MEERFWILVSREFAQEITKEEKQELSRLLAAHPDWEERYAALQPLPNATDKYEVADVNAAYLRLQEKICLGRSEAPVRRLAFWPYAAAAVLVIGLFAGLWNYVGSTRQSTDYTAWQQTITPKGQRTQLTLPDGSRVWLNADSKLRYPKTFDAGQREVLLEGEAFFDVVKNPQMPFLVKTRQATVRVLGTSFNVNAYPEKDIMETALVTGSVAITRGQTSADEEPFLLKPSERAIYSEKTNTITRDKVDTGLYTSWKEGRLRISNEPFASVLTKLERWYGVTIHLQADPLLQERFTATIERQSLEEVLQLIDLTTPIQYRIKDKDVFISEEER